MWPVLVMLLGCLLLTGQAQAQPVPQGTTALTVTLSGTLPVGTLALDGPPTPEQLALLLPVTGPLPRTATATVRYRETGTALWRTGHPLFRIQPTFTAPAALPTPDAFAWPLIDLTPGRLYDVDVTLTDGQTVEHRTGTFPTRALPPPTGPATKMVKAGATGAQVQAALDALTPGDVLELAAGTYTVTGLRLQRSGTPTAPIVIRGASRTGTTLSASTAAVLEVWAANDIIIESLTLQGSGVDAGMHPGSFGVVFKPGLPTGMQTRVTIRNVTMQGVDMGVQNYGGVREMLVYDSTFLGNDRWDAATLAPLISWNDGGLNLAGYSNAAFNNTLTGFGDCFSYADHIAGFVGRVGVNSHVYRNEASICGDDAAEVDEGNRNLTLYDNHFRNTMTAVSLDPLSGGPLLVARNIWLNTGRAPFKFNNMNSGQFLYNNTLISTQKAYGTGTPGEGGWWQPANGPQRGWGYRNNVLIYLGNGPNTIKLDNGGYDWMDFDHNAWYPGRAFGWPSQTFATLAAAYAGLPVLPTVFSGLRRHEGDVLTTANPWTQPAPLGPDYLREVTTRFVPVPAPGTGLQASGAVIPGVTDGYSGALPDRGAVIAGRPAVLYGDRMGGAGPPPPPPAPPTPDITPPSVPMDLTVSATSPTQTSLAWTASSDAVGVTSYRVLRGGVLLASLTGTVYRDTGLTPETTYSYTVEAIDAAGNDSGASAPVTVTTPALPPIPPVSGLQVGLRVQVGGMAPVPILAVPDAAVTVTSGGKPNVLGTQPVGKTGTITGGPQLAGGVTYWNVDYDAEFWVDGWTAESALQPGPADTTPPCSKSPGGLVPGVTIASTTATQVNLRWQACAEVTVAGIAYQDNVTAGYVRYEVLRDGAMVGSTASTNYQDVGLVPQTAHTYTVRARDLAGNATPLSTPLAVTTPALPTSDPLLTLPPGTWWAAPNSAVVGVEFVWPKSFLNSGANGYKYLVESSGAYDSTRHRFMIWGGGHNDYAGNEVYGFDLTTLAWARLTEPSLRTDNVGATESTGYYPDGQGQPDPQQPRARHTNNYLQYLPALDRLCSLGLEFTYPASLSVPNVDCLEVTTKRWETKHPMPKFGSGAVVLSVVDATTGHAWVHARSSNGVLIEWDPLANTWTTRSAPFTRAQDMTATYDTKRHRFVALGSNAAWYATLNQPGLLPIVNTRSLLHAATATDVAIVNARRPGFVYDAALDVYVAWSGDQTSTMDLHPEDVYVIHPDTWEVKRIVPAAANTAVPKRPWGAGGQANAIFTRFTYLPQQDVFLLVNNLQSEPVFFYKLDPAALGWTVP